MCADCRWRGQNPWAADVLSSAWPCLDPKPVKPSAPAGPTVLDRDPEERCVMSDLWPEECGCASHIAARRGVAS